MRLIDADEYKERISHYPTIKAIAFKELRYVKTIDAEPVRHGKWKKSGYWGRVCKCDQCGNYLDFDGVNAGRGSANYCPNCGAKMDAPTQKSVGKALKALEVQQNETN